MSDEENGQEPVVYCQGCGKVIKPSEAPLCDDCIDKGE